MTTILKQMGIQQWRFRTPAPDSEVGAELRPDNEESLLPQSTEHENTLSEVLPAGDEFNAIERPLIDDREPEPVPAPLDSVVVPAVINMPKPVGVSATTALSAPEAAAMPVPIAMPANASDPRPAIGAATAEQPMESLDWQGLQALIDGQDYCHTCGSANSNLGVGDPNADWLFVSDAPSRSDLAQHQMFSGRAGQLYEAMLLAVGLDRAVVYTTSVFKCVASDDLSVIPNCDKLLQRQIELLKPKVIVTFGEFAAQSVVKSNESLEKLRSQDLSCHISKVPIVASYSPIQLLDEPSLKAGAWQDLKKCLAITR